MWMIAKILVTPFASPTITITVEAMWVARYTEVAITDISTIKVIGYIRDTDIRIAWVAIVRNRL